MAMLISRIAVPGDRDCCRENSILPPVPQALSPLNLLLSIAYCACRFRFCCAFPCCRCMRITLWWEIPEHDLSSCLAVSLLKLPFPIRWARKHDGDINPGSGTRFGRRHQWRAQGNLSSDTPASTSGPPSSPPPPRHSLEDGPGGGWNRVLRWIRQTEVQTFILTFSAACTFRMCVMEPRYIPSESMSPTFRVGDRFVVDKFTHRLGRQPIVVGDIVTFRLPWMSRAFPWRRRGPVFVKRIVGMAGDRISIHRGKLHRNGVAIDEHYTTEPALYILPEVTVPPGHVFVLGDNRNNSYDSHVWGCLPIKSVMGRAFWKYWPPQEFGPLKA